MSIEDPLNECIKDFMSILTVRLGDPVKLEELDVMLGMIFDEIYQKIQSQEMMM